MRNSESFEFLIGISGWPKSNISLINSLIGLIICLSIQKIKSFYLKTPFGKVLHMIAILLSIFCNGFRFCQFPIEVQAIALQT